MFEDLTGKQINNWLVLGFSHKDSKRNYWNCECQCEKKVERVICTYNLTHGLTKSCGCGARSDLVGKKFNNWTVVEFSHVAGGKTHWKCQCVCGEIAIRRHDQLVTGSSKGCGCEKNFCRLQNTTSSQVGYSMSSRLAKIWRGMHSRCQKPNYPKFEDYGGRGIKVCDEWHYYDNFREWALSNGYDKKLELDRIDNDGNYEPSNCRWATRKEQCNNTRRTIRIELNDTEYTASELSEKYGIKRELIVSRYHKGINDERIVSKTNLKTGARLKKGIIGTNKNLNV